MTSEEEVNHYISNEFCRAAAKAAVENTVRENDQQHKSICRGTHLQTKQVDMISFFNPTIQCFCQKPASRYYTMEYGPILECASYDPDSPHFNPRYVCGFHVHEFSWKKLHEQLEQGFPVCSRYIELRACPLYNFTYCAMFKVKNDYKSVPINSPTCFCGNPIKVVLDEVQEAVPPTTGTSSSRRAGKDRIDYETLYITNFICSNRTVPGARKCNFLNSADKSVFLKPNRQLHKQVDYAMYMEQRTNILRNIQDNISQGANLGLLIKENSSSL